MNAFRDALGSSRVYPITDTRISGRSHAEQVKLLSEAGATVIQLREKILSPREFHREATAALDIARATGVRIIINDRVDIALALHADGVHLGQSDLPPVEARRLLGPDAIIGFSTHNLEQAHAATELPVDYIAVGPIFATTSKEAAEVPVGTSLVTSVRKALGPIPLVAIGGITSENARAVISAGADAVAVISDLWDGESSRPKPLNTYVSLT